MLRKKCSRCQKMLPLSKFWRNRSRPDGLQARCCDCQNESMKEVRSKIRSVTPERKRCPECGKTKAADQFHKNRYRHDGLRAWCKSCDAVGDRRYSRNKILKRYGLTKEQYSSLLEAVGGRCPVCTLPFLKLPAVDHDHRTGAVRGLLCTECNLGLGKLKDDPEILERALVYLRDSRLP